MADDRSAACGASPSRETQAPGEPVGAPAEWQAPDALIGRVMSPETRAMFARKRAERQAEYEAKHGRPDPEALADRFADRQGLDFDEANEAIDRLTESRRDKRSGRWLQVRWTGVRDGEDWQAALDRYDAALDRAYRNEQLEERGLTPNLRRAIDVELFIRRQPCVVSSIAAWHRLRLGAPRTRDRARRTRRVGSVRTSSSRSGDPPGGDDGEGEQDGSSEHLAVVLEFRRQPQPTLYTFGLPSASERGAKVAP